MQRELVAEVHPPDFSQHFHADHPVFSCSKSEQKQLNTWVSFQSAEQPLLGQFSVSGNSMAIRRLSTSRWAPNWHSEVGVLQKICKGFANRRKKKGVTVSDDPSRPPSRADFVW